MVSPAVNVPVPVGTSPLHSAVPFAGMVASSLGVVLGCLTVQLSRERRCSERRRPRPVLRLRFVRLRLPTRPWLSAALWWQRAGVGGAESHPLRELALGTNVLGIDSEPSLHQPAAH